MEQVLSTAIIEASKTELFKNLEEHSKDPFWKKFCMISPSDGASTTYEWLAGMPGMEEWLDERIKKGLKKYKYTIENKEWEATLAFNRRETLSKKFFQIIKSRLPLLAASAAEHPEELLIEVIEAGTSGLCYDATEFFNTAHPVNDTTFSNLLTGSGIDTVAHIKSDVSSMFQKFYSYTKRNGHSIFSAMKPLKPVILHSVTNDEIWREVIDKEVLASGERNEYYKRAEHYPVNFITGNSWYAFILDRAVKPFVFQTVQGIKGEWNDQEWFNRKQLYYGVDAVYNVGYGVPQLAIKVANS